MSDLISREALKKAFTSDTRNKYVFVCLSCVLETIDNAPLIEYTFEEAFQKTVCANKLYCPTRPHGKWIDRNGHTWCSVCRNDVIYIDGERPLRTDYCPNCGAKMDGGEDNEK